MVLSTFYSWRNDIPTYPIPGADDHMITLAKACDVVSAHLRISLRNLTDWTKEYLVSKSITQHVSGSRKVKTAIPTCDIIIAVK